jgi:hypothetical protein
MITMESLCRDVRRIFQGLQIRGDQGKMDSYTDAVSKYLLLQFGFSMEMVGGADLAFIQQLEDGGAIEDINSVITRVAGVLKEHDFQKHSLVSSLGAIVQTQESVSAEQERYLIAIRDCFEMEPSEFGSSFKLGMQWSVGLKHVSEEYIKSGRYGGDLES